jgi:Icc-related predicted phosphoesterase
VRLLALADEPPRGDLAVDARRNAVDVVVTLGDLRPVWLASLAGARLPRIGVAGNHDGERDLIESEVEDVHLRRVEIGGWTFAGFEGCVRYRRGPHQYTQREAERLARRLPGADVLLCHCPPWGVNDEPDDPAHVGFRALRAWVERHEPRYLLHGHTTPDPRRRVHRLGATQVVWVRGARTVALERE